MSDHRSLAAVTTSLRRLLEDRMGAITIDVDNTPATLNGTSALVNLYLYRVERNPFTSNFDWAPDALGTLHAPPFGLNLHYLITPYGPTQTEIQRTLGEVMQVLHDQPVLRAGHPLLPPELAEIVEELRIVPRTLPLHEMLDLWRAFGERAFRLSLVYEVSAVLVDSLLTRTVHPVQQRVLDVGVLR